MNMGVAGTSTGRAAALVAEIGLMDAATAAEEGEDDGDMVVVLVDDDDEDEEERKGTVVMVEESVMMMEGVVAMDGGLITVDMLTVNELEAVVVGEKLWRVG